jgi:hypothetical protein
MTLLPRGQALGILSEPVALLLVLNVQRQDVGLGADSGPLGRLRQLDVIQIDSGVADDRSSADSDPAFPEINVDGNQHLEIVAATRLGDVGGEIRAAAELMFKPVARHFRAVDPFVKNPVHATVLVEIHLFGHVFLDVLTNNFY